MAFLGNIDLIQKQNSTKQIIKIICNLQTKIHCIPLNASISQLTNSKLDKEIKQQKGIYL